MLTLHILTTMSVYPKVNPTYTFDIKPVSVHSEEINIPLYAHAHTHTHAFLSPLKRDLSFRIVFNTKGLIRF